MNRRRPKGALSHSEVGDLIDAAHFAERIGKPLNTRIHLQPARMDRYPPDLGMFFQAFLNKLRIWCVRRGFGYHAIWVRENYEGPRHEHLHVMLNVRLTSRSREHRDALETTLNGWFPEAGVVHVDSPTFDINRRNLGLLYMLKQMTPQAWFSLAKTVRRERVSSKTGAAVAPVMGKRCGVSRSLSRNASDSTISMPREMSTRSAREAA